ASAPCSVGLPASACCISRSNCGSLKAFHQSAATCGAASLPSPKLAGTISLCDGVVAGARTQPSSGNARSNAAARLLLNLVPGMRLVSASPDSAFLMVNASFSMHRQKPINLLKLLLFRPAQPVRHGNGGKDHHQTQRNQRHRFEGS